MVEVVLLAEDEPASKKITTMMLQRNNYHVVSVGNGKEALDYLQNTDNQVDIILLDYFMPIMDGISFLQHYTSEYFKQRVPVIMLTGSGSSQHIEDAIKLGVYYYLTKPIEENVLLSIVAQALVHSVKHNELRDIAVQQYDIKSMLRTISLEVRNFGEIRSLSRFLSGFYPCPQAAIVGVYELLVNALEHGNLDIDFKKKKQLLKDCLWEQEVSKRQVISPYKDRKVKVDFAVSAKEITLVIQDEGAGFDYEHFMSVISRKPNESCGRGILIAREMSFDILEYQATGNRVVCIKKLSGE